MIALNMKSVAKNEYSSMNSTHWNCPKIARCPWLAAVKLGRSHHTFLRCACVERIPRKCMYPHIQPLWKCEKGGGGFKCNVQHDVFTHVSSTYSRLFMINSDDPYDLMSFAVIWIPFEFDRVFSDTNKSPMSMGSMLGMSISGMPFTRNGRNISMLVLIQSFSFGSLFRHMCRYSAATNK